MGAKIGGHNSLNDKNKPEDEAVEVISW